MLIKKVAGILDEFCKLAGQTFLITMHSRGITQYSIGSPIDLVKILLSFHSIDVL